MKRKLLIFVVSLFLFLLGGGVYWLKKNFPVFPPTPTAKPAGKIAKIGKEEIYQNDLDFWADAYNQRFSGLDETKKREEILKIIQEQSLILQEAEKQKIATLTPEVFNHPSKDYPQRNILVDKLKTQLEKLIITNVSGEAVSVWFYNPSAGKPIIPFGEAKKFAWEKINKVYQKVKEGEIDIQQAGEIIKNDASLAKIDPAYQTNAYLKFENKTKANPPFAKEELNRVAFALKEGEVSEILVVPYQVPEDPENPNSPFVEKECHYTFIKINRRLTSDFISFSQWLDEKKKEYPIQLY